MPKTVRESKVAKKPVKKGNAQLKKKRKATKELKRRLSIERVTTILSVIFLTTAILVNVNSLKNLALKPTPTPTPAPQPNRFFGSPIGTSVPSDTTSNKTDCKQSLGPVEITTPQENDTVTDNPVTINISYDDETYCGAAWSYRINGGSWSGYDNRSVALYNLPRGSVTFELRIRSIVTDEERTMTRHFTYNGNQQAIAPDTPNSSGSAN